MLGYLVALTLAWLIRPMLTHGPPMMEIERWSTVAVLSTLASMLVTAALVHRTLIQTYSLFLGCSAIFVGGRFIAHALGFDPSALGMESNLFAVHRPGFITLELGASEAIDLAFYIVTALMAMHVGYLWAIPPAVAQPAGPPPEWLHALKWPALALTIVSIGFYLYSYADTLQAVYNEGYISLYSGKVQDFTLRGRSIAQYGLLIALGLAFASGTVWPQALVLTALGAYYIGGLAIGVRGGVMGFGLLCVWLYHSRIRRIDLTALISIPLLLAGLLAASMLGVRNPHFGRHISLFIPWLLDNQGLSMVYIAAARRIAEYPLLAYIHGIVPIAPVVASLAHHPIPLDQLYFGQYLSKMSLAGTAYRDGFGMGWSVLSDFHAFTFGVPGIYVLSAGVCGAGFSKLVNSTNPIVVSAHAMVFVKLMLLARTGLYSIIPYLLGYVAILIAVRVTCRLLRHEPARGRHLPDSRAH